VAGLANLKAWLFCNKTDSSQISFWSIEKMRSCFTTNTKNSPELYTLLESEAIMRSIEKTVRSTEGSVLMEAVLLPDKASVITHCNAGALATSGYGTLLVFFRAARDAGKQIKVYADETRPAFSGRKAHCF
jgi:methylthioribose-1-phosphate isomerase